MEGKKSVDEWKGEEKDDGWDRWFVQLPTKEATLLSLCTTFSPLFFFLPTAKALYGTAPGFSLAAVSWNVSQDTPWLCIYAIEGNIKNNNTCFLHSPTFNRRPRWLCNAQLQSTAACFSVLAQHEKRIFLPPTATTTTIKSTSSNASGGGMSCIGLLALWCQIRLLVIHLLRARLCVCTEGATNP